MNTTKRTYRILISVALAALLISSATSVMARGPGKGDRCGNDGKGGFGPAMKLERLASKLDLSEDQVAAIRKIREDGQSQKLDLRKKMMRLRNEMRGEMLQDDPSQKKLLDLNEQIGELRTEMQAQRLKHRLAIRQELTPEQRDRMLVLRERGRGGHGGRHGKARGRGGFGGPRAGRGIGAGECLQDED